MEELKKKLLDYCTDFVETQIEHVQTAINLAKESAQNENKSSAGDKHETGKSLMQLEQENNSVHLSKMLGQKRIIILLQYYENNGVVKLGSLIETDKGFFYIALGIGKVEIGKQNCFVVSPSSPVGKSFQNKAVNDEVSVNGNMYKILNLL